MPYKLYLFDLDGTLADMNSDVLYPEAKQWFADNSDVFWHVVTNQGGVGLKYWMEKDKYGKPEEYPSESDIWNRFCTLFPNDTGKILVCYAYQSKTSGKWGPIPYDARMDMSWQEGWRKPSPGMLLYAMQHYDVLPEETLMVGDRDEDKLAAEAAGCHFMWANEFFKR